MAVLRFLSGPLCGCEYSLSAGSTLVIAAAETALMANKGEAELPEFPDNAIVIPMADGCNFEIVIDDPVDAGFRLRTFVPAVEEKNGQYQKICHVGTLSFALRPNDTVWLPEIVGAVLPLCKVGRPRRVSARDFYSGLGILFVLAVLAVMLWMQFGENKKIAEVAAIVDGAIEPYKLLSAPGGIVYVFAESERDAVWAKQALVREAMLPAARVFTMREEEGRIGSKLLEHYPKLAFYRLMLADPARPVLLLSQERSQVGTDQRQALINSLHAWMPYAEKISIGLWSDVVLDRKARSGLESIGIAFERSGNASHVTYHIQGNLNDIEITQLRYFTDHFYRDYGRRYIHFSVSLKEDWLKGKSFKYGGSGYVKMAPQHWFFPQSL